MGEVRKFGSGAKDTPRWSMPCPLSAVVVGEVADRAFAASISGEERRRRMEQIRRELIEPVVLQHRAWLVKATTGGFIAIFDHPVKAARCGIAIQQRIAERNQSLARPRIEYRIGVDLGEVTTDSNDTYGNAIDVASGLAAIAGSGQVCISESVREQIRHRLFFDYESLGDRRIRAVAGSVTCYCMHSRPGAVHSIGKRREIILIILLCLSLLVISSGAWYLFEQSPRTVVGTEPSRRAQTMQGEFQTDGLAGGSEDLARAGRSGHGGPTGGG